MDCDVSPTEASLGWSIPKIRRKDGARAGGFPGATGILLELEEGPSRARRGLQPHGRVPIREGQELFNMESGGQCLGKVRSGGFGPTIGAPIAVALLDPDLPDGTTLWADRRGTRVPLTVVPLPFVKTSYKR